MVGGDLTRCSGSNEDSPESSQDLWSLGWFRVEIQDSTFHRSGLVLNVSLLYCPLRDITNVLHNTVER